MTYISGLSVYIQQAIPPTEIRNMVKMLPMAILQFYSNLYKLFQKGPHGADFGTPSETRDMKYKSYLEKKMMAIFICLEQ